ncbi:MAG TPA: D-aminoacyl-tRNA deacylase [Candidatus Binatia bacterium]|nr:D-aminoacyl-tRNA deacylase [Candidatus Binatia bacterium]
MRAVLQRVSQARVTVGDEVVGEIGPGVCVLLGVGKSDNEETARWLADKIASLRIFADEQGRMNRSIKEVGGSMLLVSQFTLYGDCRKGNRPSFSDAAAPDDAERLYRYVASRLRSSGLQVATGQFQAHMRVALVNDGPVTIFIEN